MSPQSQEQIRLEAPADAVYVQLTRDELKGLMAEAVQDAFTKLGVDTSKPFETQKDFAHLRKWRVAVDSATNKGFLAVLTILIGGLMGALWLGIQAAIKGAP